MKKRIITQFELNMRLLNFCLNKKFLFNGFWVLYLSFQLNHLNAQTWTHYFDFKQATSIIIDAQGNKWIGTFNSGVVKFDGTNWTTYSIADGLSSNRVSSIAKDAQGNIWLGTYQGISKFDGTTWTKYAINMSNISDIAIDAQGNKWIGGLGGIAKFDGTILTPYSMPFGQNVVTSIAIDAQGNKWCGTNGGGMLKFDGTNWTFYNMPNGITGNSIFDIEIDFQDNKWIGTNNDGLLKFDGVNWTQFTTANGLISNSVTSVSIDAQGKKWCGSSIGLTKFDESSGVSYSLTNGLGNTQTNFIAIDAQGNKWCAGFGDAVLKLEGTTWSSYIRNGLADNGVLSITVDDQDNTWFGTLYSGVSKFDGSNWTTYNASSGLAGDQVYAVAFDAQGNKWFGTHNGVTKFDGNTWINYRTTVGLADNKVSAIAIDSQGNKWFGTDYGISKFDGAAWTTYRPQIGPTLNKVYAIAIDAQGNKWFGTNDGVLKFDGTTWTSYKTSNGLAGNEVRAIAIDAQGNKWFAAAGGVSKFDGTTWTTYRRAVNGLLDNNVRCIAIDAQGNKWFGTTGGVSKLDGTNWTTYPINYGFSDNQVYAIDIDRQGNLWFGSTYGVSSFGYGIGVGNLIQNGDFEQGNVGFTTDLKYLATSDMNAGRYTVGTNTNQFQNNFANCNTNHTPNGRLMFIANGSTSADSATVWSQTVAVQPNTEFTLSMWYANVSNFPDNQKLQFQVNDVLIGQRATNPPNVCDWGNLQTNWNSGSSTTATIKIINHDRTFLGNDFAIDDISMTLATFCPTVNISIQSLIPDPNKTAYAVMEGATIHHYFKLIDPNGNPIPNIKIKYKLDNSPTIYLSTQSDAKGVIDLNIRLSGNNPESVDDDLIKANQTTFVSFVGLFNLCVPTITRNDFSRISISVQPFESDDIQKYLYGAVSGSASVCGGCLGWGNYGVNGFGISSTQTHGFYLSWNQDNIYTLTAALERTKKAYINAFSLPSAKISIEPASAYIKPYIQGEITNIKLDEPTQYLRMLSVMLRSSSKITHTMQYLADGIDLLLSNTSSQSNFGSGYAYGVAFGYHLDANMLLKGYLPPIVNFGTPQPINIKNYDKDAGFEVAHSRTYNGIEITKYKHFDKYKTTSFAGDLGQYLQVPIDKEEHYEHLVNYVIQSSNNAKIDGVFNYNRLGEALIKIGGTPTKAQLNQEFDYKFGGNALTFMDSKVKDGNSPIYNNGTAKLLTGNGNAVPLLFNGLDNNPNSHFNGFQTLKYYVENNYNNFWLFPQLQTIDRRKYSHVVPVSIDIPVSPVPTKIGPFGFGADIILDLSSSVSGTYPTATKVYHPQLQRLIPQIEYPSVNSFVNLPKAPATDFIKALEEATQLNMPSIIAKITDGVSGIFQDVAETVRGDVAWGIVNSVRKTLSYQVQGSNINLLVLDPTATSFSTLMFLGKDTSTAFDPSTKLDLAYFYPRGEVKAFMSSQDTAVIISDIFYFNAIKGTDTLSRTPRSTFNIQVHLAEQDLISLGLDTSASVQLIYQGFKDSLWQSLGSLSLRQNDRDFNFNRMGVYALALTLQKDTISPDIQIITTPNLRRADSITIKITDTQSGINWRSVSVLANGQIIPWTRDGITPNIKIAVSNFPNLMNSDNTLEVIAKDLSDNYGHTLATLSVVTHTIELHTNLLKLYPNPTNGELNIVWNISKAADVEFIISDMFGKVVHKSKQKSSSDIQNTVLDIHHLAQGTYLLYIKQEGIVLDTRKFLKL